jgi:hypothetical protein
MPTTDLIPRAHMMSHMMSPATEVKRMTMWSPILTKRAAEGEHEIAHRGRRISGLGRGAHEP